MKSFLKLGLISSMMFFGCNSPVNDNIDYSSLSTIFINTNAEKQELKFSEIANRIEFVDLETKDGLLISGVRNVFVNKEHIILHNTKNVWVFNREGNHLITFEAVGEGPGEFSYISNIEVNFEKKELYIIDFYKQKMLIYNINGTFKSEFKTGIFVDDFLPLDDGKFVLFTSDPNENTVHHINFYDTYAKKIYLKYLPMNIKRLEFLNFWKNTNFFKRNGQIYFNLNPYDTIYSVTDEKISASFVSDYGKYKIPVSDYDKQFEDILHFNNYIRPLNFAYNWDNFFLVKDRLYFTFAQNGKVIRAFANIDNSSSRLIETFVDDLSLPGKIISFDEWIWPIGITENDLVFILESLDFKQLYSQKLAEENYAAEASESNIRLILEEIDITSNPILVFLKQY